VKMMMGRPRKTRWRESHDRHSTALQRIMILRSPSFSLSFCVFWLGCGGSSCSARSVLLYEVLRLCVRLGRCAW
jgi:hypothetical protein